MRNLLWYVFVTLVWVGAFAVSSFAATGTSTESGAINLLEWELSVSNIITQDDANIKVEFNDPIIVSSVRLRITKQSSSENIKIDTITGSELDTKSVDVKLSDLLEEGSVYTLTVVSAISEDGVVIKDGAQAIKEFTPASPLKRSLVTFNAPNNPNAVVVAESKEEITTKEEETQLNPIFSSGAEVPIKEDELPLTGMNPVFFILIACWFSLALLLKRKTHTSRS